MAKSNEDIIKEQNDQIRQLKLALMKAEQRIIAVDKKATRAQEQTRQLRERMIKIESLLRRS